MAFRSKFEQMGERTCMGDKIAMKTTFGVQSGDDDETHKRKVEENINKERFFYIVHHAEVTSNRTNLSPFTKDYRGAAS